MSNNNPDTNGIHNEVVSQITTLMISAFGLVAALAWNGAIQAMFKQVFGTADGLTAQLSYAIIDCNKRNYWGGNCRDINIKRDFDWCKAKCQREKECLYWKMIAENGEVRE